MTYTLIAHTELTSSQANITFSSIPATFTDLVLVTSSRRDRSDTTGAMAIRFNGSTSNYSTRALGGNGSSSYSYTVSYLQAGEMGNASDTSNTFTSNQTYIANYRVAANKSVSVDAVTENNGTTAFQVLAAGLWSDTSAITSLSIFPEGGNNFVSGSSATLFGITAGSSGGVVVS